MQNFVILFAIKSPCNEGHNLAQCDQTQTICGLLGQREHHDSRVLCNGTAIISKKTFCLKTNEK